MSLEYSEDGKTLKLTSLIDIRTGEAVELNIDGINKKRLEDAAKAGLEAGKRLKKRFATKGVEGLE